MGYGEGHPFEGPTGETISRVEIDKRVDEILEEKGILGKFMVYIDKKVARIIESCIGGVGSPDIQEESK